MTVHLTKGQVVPGTDYTVSKTGDYEPEQLVEVDKGKAKAIAAFLACQISEEKSS